MSVQKNFVVQNGLEVNKNLIFADPLTNKVGILTDSLKYSLHVNGGIGATDLKVSGISTFNNIILNGGVSVGTTTGISGQYLISTGVGVTWGTIPNSRVVTSETATPGQITFNISYSIGFIDVFINGIRLSESEFVALNGTSVTLDVPCFGGESVDFVTYRSTSSSGINGITVSKNNVIVGTALSTLVLNFTGTGVSLENTGVAVTIAIPSYWTYENSAINTIQNVGIGTTTPTENLTVIGDARVTGILTVGTSSITLDGINNNAYVGSGVTIYGDTGELFLNGKKVDIIGTTGNINTSGIITASYFYGDGSNLTGIVATGSGGESYWTTEGVGIYTGSSVGIGTTNPKTKLQIGGVIGFNDSNIRIGDNTTGANLVYNPISFTGINNIFMGIGAGNSTTDARDNNFLGYSAGYYNTIGNRNNFIGGFAGYANTTGNNNNFFGYNTGQNNTIGSYNNFLGNAAGYYNTIGNRNNFLGNNAGYYNTTGSYNNFFSHNAGYYNTTGSYNNFLGNSAGKYNTVGNDNNFFGNYIGLSTSASNKIIIGRGNAYNQLFDSPDTTKDTQFAVGIRTDANPSEYWLVGDENFNIGIGTTNPKYTLDVGGNTRVKGFIESQNTSSIANNVLGLDATQGTVFTHTTSANIGIVSFTGISTNRASTQTFTVLVTQGAVGYNTTAATGIGTQLATVVTEDGVGYSTHIKVGGGTTMTLTDTAGALDILTFMVSYDGNVSISNTSFTVIGMAATNFIGVI